MVPLLGGSKSGASFWVGARVVPFLGREKKSCLFLGGSNSGASFWKEASVVPLSGREQK